MIQLFITGFINKKVKLINSLRLLLQKSVPIISSAFRFVICVNTVNSIARHWVKWLKASFIKWYFVVSYMSFSVNKTRESVISYNFNIIKFFKIKNYNKMETWEDLSVYKWYSKHYTEDSDNELSVLPMLF